MIETLSAAVSVARPGLGGCRRRGALVPRDRRGARSSTEEDVWTEELADLGTVELRNVVTVVPGRSEETIVVVAHRDNAGTDEPLGDNASGTAALIELARGFAPQELGPDPLPAAHPRARVDRRGLVRRRRARALRRDVATRRQRDRSRRPRRPRRAAGRGSRSPATSRVSPARPLVRTAAARVEEQVGVSPSLPCVPDPARRPRRCRSRSTSRAAFSSTGSPPSRSRRTAAMPRARPRTRRARSESSGSASSAARRRRSQLSRHAASEARSARPTASSSATARRAGGRSRLVLVLAVVPFALGLVDLLVRGRRRGLPFAPGAARASRRLGLCCVRRARSSGSAR